MFDIGWPEILVIAIVLIVVVGPKDLPPMLRAFGKTTAKFRKMANEFRGQFDEALKEAELDDVRKTISDARSLNPMNYLRDAVNPMKQAGDEIRRDLEKTVSTSKPVAVPDSGMKLADSAPDIPKPAEPVKGAVEDAPAKPAAKKAAAKKPAGKSAAKAEVPAKAAPAKPAAKATAAKKPAARKPAASRKKDQA